VRAMPIRKDDEVTVVRGDYKSTTGKVVQVYRKKYVIHVEGISCEKNNGTTVNIGIHPSQCVITKLALNKDRKDLLARKDKTKKGDAAKGKHTEATVASATNKVD